MPSTKPTKKQLARMKVLSDLGESATAIGKKLGKSHTTIGKYLRSDVFTDPGMKDLVERLREKELEDLHLLGAKGRQRLHELLDEGNSQMIPTIALVDRTFQQRRLLEGKSTANIASLTKIIEAAHKPSKNPQDPAQEPDGA